MTEDQDSGRRNSAATATDGQSRRTFFGWLLSAAMAGGLVAAYGNLAALVGRFLYPSRSAQKNWLYVRETARIAPGESLPFKLPNGSPVHITRQASGSAGGEFRALSSTCPHLGCQVHWEAHNERFFCPCHNGVFTAEGVAVSGPPADAGQALLQFPVKVESGLLYIEAPADLMASSALPVVSPAAASPCSGCPGSESVRGRRA